MINKNDFLILALFLAFFKYGCCMNNGENQKNTLEKAILAIVHNDWEKLETLLSSKERKWNINSYFHIAGFAKMSLLECAVRQKNVTIATLLLQHGAAVDIKNGGEETPLFIAVKDCDFPMIRLLLSYNASLDRKNRGGHNPFGVITGSPMHYRTRLRALYWQARRNDCVIPLQEISNKENTFLGDLIQPHVGSFY
jgi:hypothetical protein